MRTTRPLSTVAAMLAILLLRSSFAFAANKQSLKVGKKGEIMLTDETKVGDLVLQPGHYEIQHRVRGSDHFIRFTQFKGMHHQFQPWSGPSTLADAGDAKCRLVTLRAKAERTAVFITTVGGEWRITKVEIKGENVAHTY